MTVMPSKPNHTNPFAAGYRDGAAVQRDEEPLHLMTLFLDPEYMRGWREGQAAVRAQRCSGGRSS